MSAARTRQHAAHGGSWKVAYADLVTTLMALFLVLWLTSQDQRIKEAIERAFRNPFTSVTKESVGIIPNKDTQAVKSSAGSFDSASAVELNMLRRIAEDLMKTLESNPDEPDNNPIKLELIPEGMRISVFDRARRPIFEANSAKFTEYGQWIFSTLAWEIARYPATFLVELEGHTEKGYAPFAGEYGNWEISTDRANSARRKLIEHGVQQSQVRKVAGFGDSVTVPDAEPTDEINRRVVVFLKVRSGNRHD